LPSQASPAPVQALPRQHASPAPPQMMHALFTHARPALVQVSPGQQVSPTPPHAVHEPATHATPDAVQMLPVQQGWLAPPQVPQLPFAQVIPTVGHMVPAPVQKLLMQQPPPLQVLLAQQARPASPHLVQVPRPGPLQTSFASHARCAQQLSPGPPHGWHSPPTHAPVVHVLPQQRTPITPHAPPSPPEPPSPVPFLLVLSLLQPATRTSEAKRIPRMRHLKLGCCGISSAQEADGRKNRAPTTGLR
jgi:hypothetical protein